MKKIFIGFVTLMLIFCFSSVNILAEESKDLEEIKNLIDNILNEDTPDVSWADIYEYSKENKKSKSNLETSYKVDIEVVQKMIEMILSGESFNVDSLDSIDSTDKKTLVKAAILLLDSERIGLEKEKILNDSVVNRYVPMETTSVFTIFDLALAPIDLVDPTLYKAATAINDLNHVPLEIHTIDPSTGLDVFTKVKSDMYINAKSRTGQEYLWASNRVKNSKMVDWLLEPYPTSFEVVKYFKISEALLNSLSRATYDKKWKAKKAESFHSITDVLNNKQYEELKELVKELNKAADEKLFPVLEKIKRLKELLKTI